MDKKLILNLCLTLCCICSCRSESTPGEAFGHTRRISFSLHIEDYDGNAKTAVPSSTIDELHDVNTFVFDSKSRFCKDCSAYFQDYKNCSVCLPEKGMFTVYFLANAGKDFVDEFPTNAKENNLQQIKLEYPDYEEAFSEGNLPLMGKRVIESDEPSEYVNLSLKRLVSRWIVNIDTQMLNPEVCQFSINSIRVRNAAANIFPFCDKSVSTVSTDLGDYRSASEIETDGNFCLYTLENCQGILLPGSSTPKEKTYSNVKAKTGYDDNRMSLLTFIELDAKVNTLTADYNHVYYRFYLGEDDHSSFNVLRNKSTDVRVRITNDLVIGEDWRLSPDEPGEIHHPLSFSEDALFVAPGVSASVKVKHPRSLNYTIEIPETEASVAGLTYSKEAIDATTDIISFSTTRRDKNYILPYYSYYSSNVTYEIYKGHRYQIPVCFRTPDGLEQKTLMADCLTAPIGCSYTLDNHPVIMLPNAQNFSYSGQLEIKICGKNSGEDYVASNTYDFIIRPQNGSWSMWLDQSMLWGTTVYGWSATNIDITDSYERLIYDAGVGLNLTGSISNLEIHCIEHPGLEIRLGEKPVKYVSTTGALQNYPAWRMSCTGTTLNPQPKLMEINNIGSVVKTYDQLRTVLESRQALHLVNGDFEWEKE